MTIFRKIAPVELSGSVTFQGEPVRVNKFDLGGQVSFHGLNTGAIAAGAGGSTAYWDFKCGNQLAAVAIGTQTLLGPAVATTGLNVSGDQADNDGWAFRGKSSLQLGTLNKDYFTIGTSPAFYIKATFSIADVTGFDDIRLGFAKDEAHNADPAALADYACFLVLSGDIKTTSEVAGSSLVTTDLTSPGSGDWADAATHTLVVYVSAAGVVTYELDDETPGAAVAYTFTDALNVTPFWFHRHDSDVGGTLIWSEFEFGLQANRIKPGLTHPY